MKPSLQTRVSLSTMMALGLPLTAALTGCGSGPGESESRMTSFTSSESKADTAELFTVPKEQMAHLQIVAAEKGPLPRTLRLAGSVAYNAFETTPVFASIGGPVHEILVAPGQFVQAGQPLLNVTSPDYSAARSSYIKAREAFTLSDKLYARAQDLFAHGAISEADLQQAEANHNQAHADMESSADALRALGVKDPDSLIKNAARPTSKARSSLLSLVKSWSASSAPGQLLQSGVTQCFTISNTNTVWVLVNVYQSDLPFVHVGDAVEINTDSYPELFRGKISYLRRRSTPTPARCRRASSPKTPGNEIEERHVRDRDCQRRLHSRRHHRSRRGHPA